jgi:hypothetical protein
MPAQMLRIRAFFAMLKIADAIIVSMVLASPIAPEILHFAHLIIRSFLTISK